jgi:hypothetical protein
MKKLYVTILIFASACAATKTFEPTPQALPVMQQKVPGITLERANEGYTLYKNKCGSCHRLHPPSEYTISKWEKSLIEMYPKAKVTSEEEKQLIRDYVVSLSK